MERIIIDTDPGIDDTFAILLALFSSDIIVEGITTVEGNGPIDVVTRNVFRILEIAGRNDVKVYQGNRIPGKDFGEVERIHGRDAWGDISRGSEPDRKPETDHAVDFILSKVAEIPNEITIATLGPLTNIAAAVEKDPAAMRMTKNVIVMGGAIKGGNITPFSEANFYNAPEAANILFKSGIEKIIMVGLDVTRKMLITSEVRDVLNRIDNQMAKILFDISRTYVDFHWRTMKLKGFTPHDVMVVLYIMRPNLFRLADCNISVVTEGIERGRSVVDFESSTPNATVCIDTSISTAIRVMLDTLFPNNKKEFELALGK